MCSDPDGSFAFSIGSIHSEEEVFYDSSAEAHDYEEGHFQATPIESNHPADDGAEWSRTTG
jgi:hypothetical protein